MPSQPKLPDDTEREPWEGAKAYLLALVIKEYPEAVAEIIAKYPEVFSEIVTAINRAEQQQRYAERVDS
ncbi:hypothetical protein [Sinorhizobium meliloti]|uniref:hypothetical protein n=1 Tax=Rhizobium meliloti TaxID=382 RepID=UPI00299D1480|nr:hypothetical protein [Sinorhizobium meliloti]MDW9991064.1 hypothetical protein [Sinorhizobium meliloti]MDX0245464.1 hypothetical protein [Sinorhizobium meliloti]MDX0401532.1 hypothetical protein [Sinorhizobium meliloti]